MVFQEVNLKGFSIAGIAVRTTNKNGQSQKDIGELWAKFMREDITHKLEGKLSDRLYCAYTDYESDFMGAYTTILGFEVNPEYHLFEGIIRKAIPPLNYRLYKSTGALPDSVLNTWQHIWASDIKRNYMADFDAYPPNAFSSANAVVETYLSV